jgi:hypothetical protein
MSEACPTCRDTREYVACGPFGAMKVPCPDCREEPVIVCGAGPNCKCGFDCEFPCYHRWDGSVCEPCGCKPRRSA